MMLIFLSREKKEVRRLAAWGVINVVKVTWLEDCNKTKTEVKVSAAHLASELLSKGTEASDLVVFQIVEWVTKKHVVLSDFVLYSFSTF